MARFPSVVRLPLYRLDRVGGGAASGEGLTRGAGRGVAWSELEDEQPERGVELGARLRQLALQRQGAAQVVAGHGNLEMARPEVALEAGQRLAIDLLRRRV